MNRHSEIFVSDQNSILVVIGQRTLMVGLAEHKHVRVFGVASDTINYQVLKDVLIAEPSEVLKKNGCEVDPDATMGFDESDSEDVRFLLDGFAIAFANNILKLLVVGYECMDVFSINEV
jgi:hypothetical protein